MIEWFGVFNVAGVELDKIIYKVRNCSFLYTLIKRFGAFKKFKVAGVECFFFSNLSAEALRRRRRRRRRRKVYSELTQ